MAIENRRYRFNRRIVVLALFVLAAFGTVAVITLVVPPPAQDASLAPQSVLVPLPGEGPTVGGKSPVPSAPETTTPPQHEHQP
jgi:hypothetical protein